MLVQVLMMECAEEAAAELVSDDDTEEPCVAQLHIFDEDTM